MKSILFGIIVLLTIVGISWGDSFSAYNNPIDEPQTFIYCSDLGPGEYNLYPCVNQYQRSFVASGFRDRGNLNDPRILCQSENPCYKEKAVIPMGVGGALGVSNVPYRQMFRIYVPVGTVNFYCILFVPETSYKDIGIAARMGQPPTTVPTTWEEFPTTDTGYKISELRKHDCLARRCGGHITIGSGYGPEVQQGENGWLYVHILNNGSYVFQHAISMTVMVDNYLTWYNSISKDEWSHFNDDFKAPIPNIELSQFFPGDPLNVKVSLDPGSQTGQNSDLWIAAYNDYFGWYTYVYPIGWFPGINICAQIPLFGFNDFEVLDASLPSGKYTFYFAVDNGANGKLDLQTWLTSNEIYVE